MTEETNMLAQFAGHNDIRKFSADGLRVLNINTVFLT